MYPPGVGLDVTFDELLVLIVREAALRGLLIGQLSLAGEVLVTYDGALDDKALDRIAPPPAILVTDDDLVAARFIALADGDRWSGFIHLCDTYDPPGPRRLTRVDRSRAGAQIRETLTAWRMARMH